MTNNKPNDVRVVPVELLERIGQTCMFTLSSSDYEHLRAILAQPATTKVVIPERLYADRYGEGWNACLDEVAKLNGDQS